MTTLEIIETILKDMTELRYQYRADKINCKDYYIGKYNALSALCLKLGYYCSNVCRDNRHGIEAYPIGNKQGICLVIWGRMTDKEEKEWADLRRADGLFIREDNF